MEGIWTGVDAAQSQTVVWASLAAIFDSSASKEVPTTKTKEGGMFEKLGMRK